MRSANSVLLVIALCTGVKPSHASSSVCRKRETVSGSNDTGCLAMIAFRTLLSMEALRASCDESLAGRWKFSDTASHVFEATVTGRTQKNLARSWHAGDHT